MEAKKASVDAMVGSQQAKLYADCLQNKYNRRPLIFITNGFEFFYTNDYMGYPRREVSGFFTQEELQLEMDGRTSRIPLENIRISDDITNRSLFSLHYSKWQIILSPKNIIHIPCSCAVWHSCNLLLLRDISVNNPSCLL